MIAYNSIPHLKYCKLLNEKILAFYKYDGSNLRFEWSPKKGFYKFGTRTQLMDSKTPIFGEAIEIFQDTIAFEVINRIENFYGKKKINNLERLVTFCEFFGENSFAGQHEKDDEKKLKIFDIHLFRTGFIPPQELVKLFNNSEHIADVIYQGKLDEQFINTVIDNIDNKLNEGVVCKGIVKNNVEMVKIKTSQWLEKIKANFEDWEKLV